MSEPVCHIKILDGGCSTQLTRHVGDKVDGDPLWTARFLATDPDAIVKTHLDFLRAGSDIIETCSYQASVGGFKKYLGVTEQEALALIRKSYELATKAVNIFKEECPGANPQIFASIGPYGAVLLDGSEYTGNYSEKISVEELKKWHNPRIKEFVDAGVTMFAIETIPNEKEAEAILSLLENYPTVRAWLSFSCKDDKTLAHGENFQEAALKCYNKSSKQLLGIGVNCLDPEFVHNLFEGINRDRSEKIPLVVYPNSGETYSREEKEWKVQHEIVPLSSFVDDWINLGARYIGGCCRTYAEDIKNIKNHVYKHHSS